MVLPRTLGWEMPGDAWRCLMLLRSPPTTDKVDRSQSRNVIRPILITHGL